VQFSSTAALPPTLYLADYTIILPDLSFRQGQDDDEEVKC